MECVGGGLVSAKACDGANGDLREGAEDSYGE